MVFTLRVPQSGTIRINHVPSIGNAPYWFEIQDDEQTFPLPDPVLDIEWDFLKERNNVTKPANREALNEPATAVEVLDECPSTRPTMAQRGLFFPTSKDWSEYRTTITRLYKTEDRKLAEVIRIMKAQYGFTATIKMYKTKLTEWKVRKNMSWKERDTASRVLEIMQDAGSGAVKVVVGDRERNPQVFRRHIRQSRGSCRQRHSLRGSQRLGPAGVTIYQNEAGAVDLKITHPLILGGPESKVEILCKEVVAMSLALPGCPISSGLRSLLTAAGEQSQGGFPANTRVILNNAAEWVYNNLRSCPVRALLSLLRCHTVVAKYAPDHWELFEAFYQHILDLNRSLHGSQHTITRLVRGILEFRQDESILQRTYHTTLMMAVAKHAQNLLFDNGEWQSCLSEATGTLPQPNQARVLEFSNQEQQPTTVSTPKSPTPSTPTSSSIHSTTQCRFEPTFHYFNNNFEDDAKTEPLWLEIAEKAQDPITGKDVSRWNVYYANSVLGRSAEKRHEIGLAMEYYKRRLQAATDMWGKNDIGTLRIADGQATLFRRWGMDDDAEVVEKMYKLRGSGKWTKGKLK
jgi:Clr5 domain